MNKNSFIVLKVKAVSEYIVNETSLSEQDEKPASDPVQVTEDLPFLLP